MDENQKTKSIKFDMAYNFDKKLIEDISKFGIVSGVFKNWQQLFNRNCQ